jgi:F0F1-type ATP synthase membrane subunit c/vacuolar-type H+-ATPase subunit K
MISQGLFWLLVPFCVLAAAMAFAITYGEMQHHYAERREPVRQAIRTALFVLFVFLALSGFVALVVPRSLP